MYVDVFDAPVFGIPLGGEDFEGYARDANVVRVRYDDTAVSSRVMSVDLESFIDSMGQEPVIPWRGAQAIRVYDRGECSQAEPWEEFRVAIQETLETNLRDAAGVRDFTYLSWVVRRAEMNPRSFANLTFFARDEGYFGLRDDFVLDELFELRLIRPSEAPDIEVDVLLKLRVRFEAVDNQLQLVGALETELRTIGGPTETAIATAFLAQVRSAFADRLGPGSTRSLAKTVGQSLRLLGFSPGLVSCSGDDAAGDASCLDSLGARVAEIVGAPTTSIVGRNFVCAENPGYDEQAPPSSYASNEFECKLVPNCYRANHRPDGVEFVVSEAAPGAFRDTRVDPLFTVLNAAGACRRALPRQGSEVQYCYMSTVFESPTISFETCGQELLTDGL